MPFGWKKLEILFCCYIELVLRPIRDFSFAFVDDMTIGAESLSHHVSNLRLFLCEIHKSGLTLSLGKCKFTQREARLVRHIVGSDHHRSDE